ncbi:MAG: T9SS type A sorting domain-containing protein, partial [Aureispira sp.]
DDCRARRTCTFGFNNPLEYQFTSNSTVCDGGNGYNMHLFYRYRYATTNLANATEYATTALTTSGNRPFWGSLGSWGDVGADCATSGTIGNNQSSSFSTQVVCKSQVHFRWRVSSQVNSDFLEVYVNGVRRTRISGITGWATVTLPLAAGRNTVEWRYVKDGFGSVNEDRGFVDQISFTDATDVITAGSIVGNQVLCAGGNPTNLNTTAAGSAYSDVLNYQWQFSTNNVLWTNIGGATGLSYDPPAGLTQTRFYRRRLTDGCGFIGYTNTVTAAVNPLPNGNLTTTGAICAGSSANILFNSTAGTGPFDIQYSGNTLNNINNGTNIPVTPGATTTYSLTSITDNNGCVRTTGLGSSATVMVNTNSTTPTIAGVGGAVCPNSNLTLTASGGTAGTGSTIEWFTGPNGTGTPLGTGNSITVAPNSNATYYARRQGICNTTGDDSEQVTIREYIYTPLGVSIAANYCTDNAGWNHFYTTNDEIIFSLRGDLTGATANPVITINNNGTYYQTAVNVVGSCANGYSPGDELFELPRSWNVNFTGSTNGNYDIRYYFPPNEKTDLETAAANHIANNSTCNYSYTYPVPNGFYWFKNVNAAYVAPVFDQPTKLNGTTGNINGINYAEIMGITSFSGGAGGIRLSPDGSLPVELSSFKGWNNGSSNTLQWTTETELNNNRFELQRSADGRDFEKIATIAGSGTTTEFKRYLYEDRTPLLEVNYYRLRQVDHDGTATISNVIAIEVDAQQGEQRLFPNPTTGQLVYQFNAVQQEQLTLQVHNTLGQMLDSWTHDAQVGINNKVLDWTAYPAGTYHVTVHNQQGQVIYTQAIIKKMP